MEEKIKKPCPVCQSKHISTNTIMPTGGCYLHCDTCGFTTPTFVNIDEAIHEWNRLAEEHITRNQTHTLVRYDSINFRPYLEGSNDQLTLSSLTMGDLLMKDLQMVLLTATREGRSVLIHPLEYAQHENVKEQKLEIVRKLSYEVLDAAPDSEEDV